MAFFMVESTDELRTYINEYRYELLQMRPIINCIFDEDIPESSLLNKNVEQRNFN